MSQKIIQSEWRTIKNEIQKTWGKLTVDELDRSNGKISAISEIIQQKYAHKNIEITDKLNLIALSYDTNRKDIESIMLALGLALP